YVVAVGAAKGSLGANTTATDSEINFKMAAIALHATSGEVAWISQFGTSKTDDLSTVRVNSGTNVTYVGGSTAAEMGDIVANKRDFVVVALSTVDGDLLWVWQNGTDNKDRINGLDMNEDGSVLYTVGETNGVFAPGGSTGDDLDVIVLALNATSQELLWAYQGDSAEHSDDYAHSVAYDSTNGLLVVAGGTYGSYGGSSYSGGADSLILTLNASNGNLLSSAQGDGGEDDLLWDIALDDDLGEAFLVGSSGYSTTEGSAYDMDAFVLL
ncbi:unnamed protein product, partial [Discosporangium mesarthrocarpum]